MKKTAFYVVCLAAITSVARAEDLSTATAPLPPGTFTTSEHSDEWRIANALSAGPPSITDRAAVMDWPKEGTHQYRMLREGTNGWTCMPDIPGRPQHNPMCMDEVMMKWAEATISGKKPNIDRVGLSYMLMGEAREGQNVFTKTDPKKVEKWYYTGPHVMLVLPDSYVDALRGINQDLTNNEPYTTMLSPAPGSTPIWVIPVANAGERIKSVFQFSK